MPDQVISPGVVKVACPQSSQVNTEETCEHSVLHASREVQKQRKGTSPLKPLKPKEALHIAAFVLNVRDGVPRGQRGFTKSQRSSNNHEPFIFSKETEKQGHFHTGPWRRWALKCTLPGLVRPAGGAEERVVTGTGDRLQLQAWPPKAAVFSL